MLRCRRFRGPVRGKTRKEKEGTQRSGKRYGVRPAMSYLAKMGWAKTLGHGNLTHLFDLVLFAKERAPVLVQAYFPDRERCARRKGVADVEEEEPPELREGCPGRMWLRDGDEMAERGRGGTADAKGVSEHSPAAQMFPSASIERLSIGIPISISSSCAEGTEVSSRG